MTKKIKMGGCTGEQWELKAQANFPNAQPKAKEGQNKILGMRSYGIEGKTDSFKRSNLGGVLIFFTVGKMGNAGG